MRFSEALGIKRGVTAVIGGGGKTSLLIRLASELSGSGGVILCATAKMYPPDGVRTLISPSEEEIVRALRANGLLCVGERTSEGKLTLPLSLIPMLARRADFVLCEADGSKGLPLKAHAAHEPVIPKEANKTILVIGIDGVGRPIISSAHRPELYAKLLNAGLSHAVTPADAANVARLEALHDTVFINKVETPLQWEQARELGKHLGCPAVAGALQTEGEPCLLS
ncbi:MAG TPA: selenium cofactor biosynthesis protein YqeC [Feifaniaceae bacterium]|nr:selenium cofactor biosynthesis protein YqeC [Feifaniaceae bacterium]